MIRVFSNPIFCLSCIMFFLWSVSGVEKTEKASLITAYSAVYESKTFLTEKDTHVFDSPYSIMSENSFRQSSPVALVKTEALGSLSATLEPEEIIRKEIIEYKVKSGDILSAVAEKFDISLETVLWANELESKEILSEGQKLTILPVSGIMHIIENGESISYIAEICEANADGIIEFNEIGSKDEIFIGDLLIVPGGRKPIRNLASSTLLANSYFIKPVPRDLVISQGLHHYNAIDFSNGKCGEPVFASAGGTVQKTGFHHIAGNYVRVLHPNGIVTFYGHLSKITVGAGQRVFQGEIIGYVGNTGYTIGPSGCHLHFEVRGGKNPFAY